jgi:tetratricopeptide (TPR) repeat protein
MTCDYDEIFSKFQTDEEEGLELFERCFISNMQRYDPAELRALFEVVPNTLSNPKVNLKIKWFKATFLASQAEAIEDESEQARLYQEMADIYEEILESPDTDRMDPLLRPKVRVNMARIKAQTGGAAEIVEANRDYQSIIEDLMELERDEELSVEITRLTALAYQRMGNNYAALDAYTDAIKRFKDSLRELEKFLKMNSVESPNVSTRIDLLNELTVRFSLAELKKICFELGVNFENLPAEKELFVIELVLLLEREERVLELLAVVKKARPDSEVWEAVEEEYELSSFARTQRETDSPFDFLVDYYAVLNNLALAYHESKEEGGTHKAIQLLREFVRYSEEIGYPEGQAHAHGSLAEVYAGTAQAYSSTARFQEIHQR